MNTRFLIWPPLISRDDLKTIIRGEAVWLLIEDNNQIVALIDISQLEQMLTEKPDDHFNLLKADIPRKKVARIHLQATLQEAREAFNHDKVEALFVQRRLGNGFMRTFGVILPQDIEASLKQAG